MSGWPWRRHRTEHREASPSELAAEQLAQVEEDTLDVQQAVQRLWGVADRLGPLIAEALREGRRL